MTDETRDLGADSGTTTTEQPAWWSRPSGDSWSPPPATPVAGPAQTQQFTWGPPDTLESPAKKPRRRGALALTAVALISALIGGAVGGVVATEVTDDDGGSSVLDPDASLGSAGSAREVSRPEGSIADIASRLSPTVVSITISRAGDRLGSGSGVVIRDDGYILTNNHVVEPGINGDITVEFGGRETEGASAEIVGRDSATDLAVIKVTGVEDLQPATLGNSDELVVGDQVIAFGSPLGLQGTVTSGIVSALNRTVNVPDDEGNGTQPLFGAIQTDAAINPGNSGGPLVDLNGRVVGINSAIASLSSGLSGQGGNIGVGFAIPINDARRVAEELIRTGASVTPSIGVLAQTIDTEAAADIEGGTTGARIERLTAGGGAAKAGLQVGDLITKIDGARVESTEDLILEIRKKRIGDEVTLTFVRDGVEQTAAVTLQAISTD